MWSNNVVFVLISFNINFAVCFTNNTKLNGLERVKSRHLNNPNRTKVPYQSSSNIIMKDNETVKNYSVEQAINNSTMHKRQKRQGSGAGKFTEAADMEQMKILRLYLTLFKNLFTDNHIGGGHPMHPDVPKPVIMLFKQRIGDFFFPPVGADAIKE